MEMAETSECIAPTPIGGKSSHMKDLNLSTIKTRRFLMLMVEEMKKAEMSSSGRDTIRPTKDGELSTLTNQLRNQPRD
jgi:hypothetical protein